MKTGDEVLVRGLVTEVAHGWACVKLDNDALAPAWLRASPSLLPASVVDEMAEQLEAAEVALMNSIPIVPYSGDGPLVALRAALARYREATKGEK